MKTCHICEATDAGTAVWQCVLCECTSLGSETKRSKVDLSICTWCESELSRTARLRCRACNVVKPRADFKPSKPRYCRDCRQAAAVKHRAANSARARARRENDPTLRAADAERARTWRQAHPEASRAAAKRQYRRTRATRLAYQRVYYRAHRDAILARLRRRGTAYHQLHRARRKLRILRGLI